MSDKLRKTKERAQRLIAKGKYKAALIEYQKCTKIDPRDLSVRQKLAETYARLGDRASAVREYQSVAGSYAADGLLLKAIAINKVILSLDPSHTETQTALANLYSQKQGGLAATTTRMPKAMSAAIQGKKRSASEIRGVPATSIGPGSGPMPAASSATTQEIDLDSEAVEVVSVEEAPGSAVALGQPVQTSLNDIMAIVDGAPDASIDLDISVADPEIVVGEEVDALPPDDDSLLIDDSGDDDGIVVLDEEVEIAPSEIPPIPLFSDLDKGAFIALTERMGLHQAEPGEILIAEGEYASSMYIVIQGKVRVVREVDEGKELKLAELSDGAFFGEMALLSDAPRTASVIAIEETMLFEISRDLLAEITKEHPSVEKVMKRFHRNRLLTNLLRTSPIFAPFSPDEKKTLIEKFKSRTLITVDQPGDGLYVLLAGRCEVLSKDAQGRKVVLAELKEGDVFGEMSMLWKNRTSAAVQTSTPCIVLRLPKADFDTLIMTHPQVLEALSELSQARTEYNQDLLGSSDEVLQDFLV